MIEAYTLSQSYDRLLEDYKALQSQLTEKDATITGLKRRISMLESSCSMYKGENEAYERSTHINDFLYEFNVNEKGEIPILIKVHGIEHSLGITERTAKDFAHIFKMHNSALGEGDKE